MKNINKLILRNLILIPIISYISVIGAAPLFASITYEASLISYWDFDEGSGTTTTDLVGTNNGTLYNGTTWTTGRSDGALSFDCVNDYINCGTDVSLSPTTEMTIETWIKPELSGKTFLGIVERDGYYGGQSGYALLVKSDNGDILWEQWNPYRSTLTSVGAITFGEWNHIVATYKSGEQKIYVNGIQTAISNNTGGLNSANDGIMGIGGRFNDTDVVLHPSVPEIFNGLIDNVSIWNKALNETEVCSIYNVGVRGFEGILDGVTTTFGDLGYTANQINQLTQLYADGKTSQPVEELDLGDGITWDYLDGNLPGDTGGAVYDIGDSWIYEGKYYIKLGSGLVGNPLGSVPELPGYLALGLFPAGLLFFKSRKKLLFK